MINERLGAFIEECWLLFQKTYITKKGVPPPLKDAVKDKAQKFGWFMDAYRPRTQELAEYMNWLLDTQDHPDRGFDIGFAHVPSEAMWCRFARMTGRAAEPTKEPVKPEGTFGMTQHLSAEMQMMKNRLTAIEEKQEKIFSRLVTLFELLERKTK